MPESNIWKFDDRILLPETFDSWQPFRANQRRINEAMLPVHASGMPPEAGKAYFLAEIQMWRMVRRCTTSITISREREIYAPIIAAELARQLETWYSHLPASLRFERQTTMAASPGRRDEGALAAATCFLQMQYFLCLTSIYWPAVFGAIYMDPLTDVPVADCMRFFESYCSFVNSAVTALACCPHSTWSIYARSVVTPDTFPSSLPLPLSHFPSKADLCLPQ